MKMPVGFSQLYWGVVQYRLEFIVGRGAFVGSQVLEQVARGSQFRCLLGDGDGPSVGAEAWGAQVRALEVGSPIRPSPGFLFSPPAGSPGQKRDPGVL